MTVVEIALLVVGVIIFVISFLMPEKEEKKSEKEIAAERELVQKIIDQEIDGMKLRINEVSNETVDNAVDRAERSLERVSNEKIMAVNEYSATILEEINKNHKEVMFLYDMLKDKQTELTNEIRKADAMVKDIGQMTVAAQNASETLLRGMGVASVSQKGLTPAQKAVFDDIDIPDAAEVTFRSLQSNLVYNSGTDAFTSSQVLNQPLAPVVPQTKNFNDASNEHGTDRPRAIALAQSKIMASLGGVSENNNVQKVQSGTSSDAQSASVDNNMQHLAYDILSGGAYSDGNIVNVNVAAKGAATSADYAAMVNNASTSRATNNNDRILELSGQGLNTVEIAKALNLGVGEVKLVLDLFK